MNDNDRIVTILEVLFTLICIISLILKLNWLIAVLIILSGIIGILAAIFKWEEILFYSHFWIDLDDNMWFRILNGLIGFMLLAGGIWWLGIELAFW